MIKFLYFIALSTFLTNIPLFSQTYSEVDNKVKNYPKSFSNLNKLADLINKDFKEPAQKARAIYTWIALNVVYDTKLAKSGGKPIKYSYTSQEEKLKKEQQMEKDLATQTLKKKKAVCQGYSTLYKQICDLTGLECKIISGTSKTKEVDIGKTPGRSDHAWNAVKISKDWKLIDATWGAGYVDNQSGKFVKEFNDSYFLTPPGKFFYNHFPEDKDWLLIKKTAKEFADLPLYYSGYLATDIKIIEPDKGIIKVDKKSPIKIVFENIKNEKITFHFSSEKKLTVVEPKNKKNLHTFEIKPGSGSYLIIYLNSKTFASFKLERK